MSVAYSDDGTTDETHDSGLPADVREACKQEAGTDSPMAPVAEILLEYET